MMFLGYDPGGYSGRGKNGCAAVEILSSGVIQKIEPHLCKNANAALEWFGKYEKEAEAIGIDTLLAWSRFGWRECDKALKEAYPKHEKSVIHQNSLYSAMTINGAIVAKNIRLPVIETHPKLFLKIAKDKKWAVGDAAIKSVLNEYDKFKKGKADHIADAIVAAWCAAQGWEHDLYDYDRGNYDFVKKDAKFPWPEKIRKS